MQLHKLYSSSYTVTANKSRRIRLSGHAACKEQTQNAYSILVENTVRDHLGDAGTDWITTKLILKKQDTNVGIGFIWLRIWTSGRLL
jgi:hypothetical protein